MTPRTFPSAWHPPVSNQIMVASVGKLSGSKASLVVDVLMRLDTGELPDPHALIFVPSIISPNPRNYAHACVVCVQRVSPTWEGEEGGRGGKRGGKSGVTYGVYFGWAWFGCNVVPGVVCSHVCEFEGLSPTLCCHHHHYHHHHHTRKATHSHPLFSIKIQQAELQHGKTQHTTHDTRHATHDTRHNATQVPSRRLRRVTDSSRRRPSTRSLHFGFWSSFFFSPPPPPLPYPPLPSPRVVNKRIFSRLDLRSHR